MTLRETAKRHAPSRRALVAAGLFTAAVAIVGSSPQLLGSQVAHAFAGLEDARAGWLWAAAACFVSVLVTFGLAWRSAIRSCGGDLPAPDAAARYSVAAAVNSFAPAKLGDALRIVLFSRALPNEERRWTCAGVYTTIGAARAGWLGLLLVGGWLAGALPIWPMLAAAVMVVAALGASLFARRRTAGTKLAHFFDAYRALGSNPRRAAGVVAWAGAAMGLRVLGAASICASLGVNRPLAAALLIIPAIDAATLLPLTPGNVGLMSGAVTVALQTKGVSLDTALTAGIALHAVEAAASIVCGAAGALLLARYPSPRLRRLALTGATAVVALTLAATFGLTVL